MNKFKIFILLNLILLLISCGTVKEGFANKKKNSSDEFLVEKKLPLVMPPDFNQLPDPKKEKKIIKVGENNIKKLITGEEKDKKILTTNTNDINNSFEESLLEKIKDN